MQCQNNLKQIGLGLQNFHDVYRKFPVGEYNDDNHNWGWMSGVLPYIEQANIYNQLKNTPGNYWFPIPGGGPNPDPTTGIVPPSGYNVDGLNATSGVVNMTAGGGVASTVINVYVCPSDVWPNQTSSNYGKTNYLANVGFDVAAVQPTPATWGCATPNGSLQNGVLLLANNNNNTWAVGMNSITDGTSNTVLVGEVAATATLSASNSSQIPIWAGGNPSWAGCDGTHVGNYFRLMDTAYPLNLKTTTNSDKCFGSWHTGGANFLFVDGSVHFIADSVDAPTYRAMGSRNGGDLLVTQPF
jgi:prepilin-type processing-associated H-X9-DG protein